MCSTWQLSVPLSGLTCSDQRQPGSNVPRPILCPFRSTSSTFPLPSLNSRTSSGDPKPLPLISVIAPPLLECDTLRHVVSGTQAQAAAAPPTPCPGMARHLAAPG